MTLSNGTAPGVPGTTTESLKALQTIEPSEVDIAWIGQNASPFLTTLTAVGRDMNVAVNQKDKFSDFGLNEITWTSGPEVFHEEQDEIVRVFTLGGAIANGTDTTIVLTSTAGLQKWDILRVVSGTSNEQMQVVSVTDATHIVVKRGFGTATAAAVSNGGTIIRLGNAVPSGIAGVDDIKVKAAKVSNYIQKFVRTLTGKDYDDLLRTYANYNGNPKDYFLNIKLAEHKKDIEYAAIFGQKQDGSAFTANPEDNYAMEGVIELAKRGWTGDYSSGFSTGALSEIFGTVNRYGKADKKFAFCGTKALSAIAEQFKGTLRNNDKISKYDLELQTFNIPNGQSVKFLQHPLFDSASGYDGHMLVLDLSEIQAVYGAGNKFAYVGVTGKTRVLPNPTKTTYAGFEIDIVTYMSLKNRNAKAHALVKIA